MLHEDAPDAAESADLRRAVARCRRDFRGARHRGGCEGRALRRTQLEAIIGDYDRSRGALGDQGDSARHRGGEESQGRRARRHRRRQCRREGGDGARHHRDEHAVRERDHDGRACDLDDARARAADSGGRSLDSGREVGKVEIRRCRAGGQDARRHRLRQHRSDRRRPCDRPQDESGGVRPVPFGRARDGDRGREGRSRRASAAERFHHAAHAAHGEDAQRSLGGRAREMQAWRAHHQLRARRADRREGYGRRT